MQPNYEEQYKKQQEDYQRSRNPFEYGQQVARRRYSEILAGLDAQSQKTQQSYSDMYQAARQRAVRDQAIGGPSLSGGMGQQRRDYISALEMQELAKIGTARQQAAADLYAQSQAAFSNAQLEGQQATQMELQNRQSELGLVQSRQAILNDNNLTDQERAEQLAALGGTDYEATPRTDLENYVDNTIGIGAAVGVSSTAAYIVGASAVAKGTATIAAGTGIAAKTALTLGIGFKAIGVAALPFLGIGLGVLAVAALGALIFTPGLFD